MIKDPVLAVDEACGVTTSEMEVARRTLESALLNVLQGTGFYAVGKITIAVEIHQIQPEGKRNRRYTLVGGTKHEFSISVLVPPPDQTID